MGVFRRRICGEELSSAAGPRPFTKLGSATGPLWMAWLDSKKNSGNGWSDKSQDCAVQAIKVMTTTLELVGKPTGNQCSNFKVCVTLVQG